MTSHTDRRVGIRARFGPVSGVSAGQRLARSYRYPHDFPDALVQQQYAPDSISGKDYYVPSDQGAERVMATRLAVLRGVLRGDKREQNG